MGCDGFHLEVFLDLTQGNKMRNRGVSRVDGPSNLRDHFLLDTEECHE